MRQTVFYYSESKWQKIWTIYDQLRTFLSFTLFLWFKPTSYFHFCLIFFIIARSIPFKDTWFESSIESRFALLFFWDILLFVAFNFSIKRLMILSGVAKLIKSIETFKYLEEWKLLWSQLLALKIFKLNFICILSI